MSPEHLLVWAASVVALHLVSEAGRSFSTRTDAVARADRGPTSGDVSDSAERPSQLPGCAVAVHVASGEAHDDPRAAPTVQRAPAGRGERHPDRPLAGRAERDIDGADAGTSRAPGGELHGAGLCESDTDADALPALDRLEPRGADRAAQTGRQPVLVTVVTPQGEHVRARPRRVVRETARNERAADLGDDRVDVVSLSREVLEHAPVPVEQRVGEAGAAVADERELVTQRGLGVGPCEAAGEDRVALRVIEQGVRLVEALPGELVDAEAVARERPVEPTEVGEPRRDHPRSHPPVGQADVAPPAEHELAVGLADDRLGGLDERTGHVQRHDAVAGEVGVAHAPGDVPDGRQDAEAPEHRHIADRDDAILRIDQDVIERGSVVAGRVELLHRRGRLHAVLRAERRVDRAVGSEAHEPEGAVAVGPDDGPADHDPPVGLSRDRADRVVHRTRELGVDLAVAAEGRVERPVGPISRDRDELALRSADVDVARDDEPPVRHDGEARRACLAGLERRAHPATDAERRVQAAIAVKALDRERRVTERPIDPGGQKHRPKARDDRAVGPLGARETRRRGLPDRHRCRHQVVDRLPAAGQIDDRRPIGPERADRRAVIGLRRWCAERHRDRDCNQREPEATSHACLRIGDSCHGVSVVAEALHSSVRVLVEPLRRLRCGTEKARL